MTHLKAARSRATRFLWLLSSLLLLSPSAAFSSGFSDKYDEDIQASVRRYWQEWPEWKWLKAQFWQESKLDPNVCSNVGACGIAQFMPGTWGDAIRALGYPSGASRFDARLSIDAGAYYQAKLRSQWRPGGRTPTDRNDLALASYNAGLGNILKAQRACGDAVLWPQIAPCMGQITGHHARETIGYVTSIHRWRRMMEHE